MHDVMTSEYKGHLYVPAGNDSNNIILCQLLKNLALFLWLTVLPFLYTHHIAYNTAYLSVLS